MFICADPGARSHTVASWLSSTLAYPTYEPGKVFKGSNFIKAHTDWNNQRSSSHNGIKIRIRPTYEKLAIHMHLFLTKNVYTQIPGFSKNPFDLETATKVTESAKEWFLHDNQINNDLYDHVINFQDTFDLDIMTELYMGVNKIRPTSKQLSILASTNELNSPGLSKNHACVVASMVLEKEHQLGLNEINRFWSFPEIYRTCPATELYDAVSQAIDKNNYGVYQVPHDL